MKSEKVFIGETELDLATQIEMAEHSLQCAINHLNDLLAKRNAELDAHIEAQAQAYFEGKEAEIYMQACKHDKEIEEAMHNA